MPGGRVSEQSSDTAAGEQDVERLSNELRRQVDAAKARISERYAKLMRRGKDREADRSEAS